VRAYFGVYLVLWTVAVSAALTNATGLGISNLTGGAISQSWGAVLHSLLGFLFVRFGGFKGFERVMKVLIGIMGFSIVACAVLTFSDIEATLSGLFVPRIPPGSGTYVLSLIGGVGGSITILSYGYWMREEKMGGAGYLQFVRADVAMAYLFTAVFGVAVMLTANRTFFVTGMQISDAQAVPRMAAMLGETLGPLGFYGFALGFWAAVFASLLGVWQSIPYLYAEFYCVVKKHPPELRRELTQVASRPYRLALLFISLAPLPFAFIGRPLFIIVAYTIVGSLFVPFVAATLLYLNNRVTWHSTIPRNHWTTNALLCLILALFAVVGGMEVFNIL
jgi:Mn2+/Fe2+ NRAMP family transporter